MYTYLNNNEKHLNLIMSLNKTTFTVVITMNRMSAMLLRHQMVFIVFVI